MNFREATIGDIPQIQIVRNSVKENMLSHPSVVTDDDCRIYLTQKGKGWVCTTENNIVAFAIADVKDKNIWALFVHPAFERKGIGKELHDIMLNWYFDQTKETVWLSTASNTRAEKFYRKAGWKEVGRHNKEIKFEMSYQDWLANKNHQ
jgi:ribosomal protein S18 acetylase RimI-like enzyme